MKLVREHINEKFTEDSDPIQDMGIGSKYLIQKWFESVGRSRYTIDDKLNVYVERLDLEGSQVKELPDNLRIRGFLNLYGTQITKLPDNLTIGGYLDIRGTKIKKLPENLTVGGNLYLGKTQIIKFPKSLEVMGTIRYDE